LSRKNWYLVGPVLQWQCHDDSNIDIVVVIPIVFTATATQEAPG